MAYRVEIHRTAQKQVLAFPFEARLTITEAIDQLARAPRPAGCKKLRGAELWRLRQGRYRIIYGVDDKTRLVRVVNVAVRREDTYKQR